MIMVFCPMELITWRYNWKRYYMYRVFFFLQLALALSPAQVLGTHKEISGVFTHCYLIWQISSVLIQQIGGISIYFTQQMEAESLEQPQSPYLLVCYFHRGAIRRDNFCQRKIWRTFWLAKGQRNGRYVHSNVSHKDRSTWEGIAVQTVALSQVGPTPPSG